MVDLSCLARYRLPMRSFLSLPKVELHRHLDCSMRFSTQIELLEAKGYPLPKTLEERRKALLIESPMSSLKEVLTKFQLVQSLLDSPEVLERLTFETVEDAAHQNVRVLELRFSPTFIAQAGLPFDQILDAILNGLQKARHLPVAVGLIGILGRADRFSEVARAASFLLEAADHFVGMDLADNELAGDVQRYERFFSAARTKGLHVTVHAGEVPLPGISKNIEDAVNILGAERIGHGIQCAYSPKTLHLVKSKKIHLEVCPTSNWLTKSVQSLSEHPLRFLYNEGISVSINTDDPGVFGYELSDEYERLHTLGFTRNEFTQMNKMAFDASFLPRALLSKVSDSAS